MNYALIFAGGVGSRMGGPTPKQFLQVGGKPILVHVIEKFSTHPEISGIVVVCKEDYINLCKKYIDQWDIDKILAVIPGGHTGQESIYHGLDYLIKHVSNNPSEDIVLIHDGVRPLIDCDLISRSISCTIEHGNSIAVSPAIETIIRVDCYGQILDTVDRSQCRYAKAPQCFLLSDIWFEHNRAIQDRKTNMIDSATLMSSYGHKLYTTDCASENIKITTPNDFYMFKGMYEASI